MEGRQDHCQNHWFNEAVFMKDRSAYSNPRIAVTGHVKPMLRSINHDNQRSVQAFTYKLS